jgi:hypothetical protein
MLSCSNPKAILRLPKTLEYMQHKTSIPSRIRELREKQPETLSGNVVRQLDEFEAMAWFTDG